jgi:intein/homing endonuclease
MDPETGESGYKQVVQTYVNETNELVHVKTAKDEIVCTREHPFYVPVRGWAAACDLRAGGHPRQEQRRVCRGRGNRA